MIGFNEADKTSRKLVEVSATLFQKLSANGEIFYILQPKYMHHLVH